MELFLQTLFALALYAGVFCNLVLLMKIKKKNKQQIDHVLSLIGDHQIEILDVLGKIAEDNDRSFLALRETLSPTKPMKTNNWDSMREAFKGPVRIEANERN